MLCRSVYLYFFCNDSSSTREKRLGESRLKIQLEDIPKIVGKSELTDALHLVDS